MSVNFVIELNFLNVCSWVSFVEMKMRFGDFHRWFDREVGVGVSGTVPFAPEKRQRSDFKRWVLDHSASGGLSCLLVHQSNSAKV